MQLAIVFQQLLRGPVYAPTHFAIFRQLLQAGASHRYDTLLVFFWDRYHYCLLLFKFSWEYGNEMAEIGTKIDHTAVTISEAANSPVEGSFTKLTSRSQLLLGQRSLSSDLRDSAISGVPRTRGHYAGTTKLAGEKGCAFSWLHVSLDYWH